MPLAFFLAMFLCGLCNAIALPIKALHLTFHKGCAKEVEAIAKELSIDLTTWVIQDLPEAFFDGVSCSNALYNMGHDRAERIWKLHSPFFHQFDLIFTSDTAALSRIFLQNDSPIPLVIWICNRFDYHDKSTLDCKFPDKEYYDLFTKAKDLPHVAVVANTAFEHVYARSKKVYTGSLVIQPAGHASCEEGKDFPSHSARGETFYLPQYHNETIFMNLSRYLERKGITNYCGRHNGLGDLKAYKGIIHLPYSWSTIALFENIKIGIPYFIPSEAFIASLYKKGNYWHQDSHLFFDKKMYRFSEWYNKEHQQLFIYFDSWEDLAAKIKSCDYKKKQEQIKKFAENHRKETLAKWESVMKKLFPDRF